MPARSLPFKPVRFFGIPSHKTHFALLKTNKFVPERRSRTSPKREESFSPARWSSHKSVYRHLRHTLTLPWSSTVHRLVFPDLFAAATISGSVTAFNSLSEHALVLPTVPFTLCSLAVGLMVTFRTNTSYNRFWEARNAWGQLINCSRDLLRHLSIYVPYTDVNYESRLRMARLVKALPVVLNFHLTTNGGHHAIRLRRPDKVAACRAELCAELEEIFTDHDDFDYRTILETHFKGNMPLMVIKAIGETLVKMEGVSIFLRMEMDKQLTRMTEVVGICEKILKTPIPTKFTRHTSRFVTLWLGFLPFALWPHCGMGTAPAALLLTYGLLGLEDIGVQIEEPFDILPLRSYCESISVSVDQFISPVEENEKSLV